MVEVFDLQHFLELGLGLELELGLGLGLGLVYISPLSIILYVIPNGLNTVAIVVVRSLSDNGNHVLATAVAKLTNIG
jgi:hypothetical protein